MSRRKQHVDILRIWIPFEALPPPRERARQGWLPRLGRCSDYPSLLFFALESKLRLIGKEKKKRDFFGRRLWEMPSIMYQKRETLGVYFFVAIHAKNCGGREEEEEERGWEGPPAKNSTMD